MQSGKPPEAFCVGEQRRFYFHCWTEGIDLVELWEMSCWNLKMLKSQGVPFWYWGPHLQWWPFGPKKECRGSPWPLRLWGILQGNQHPTAAPSQIEVSPRVSLVPSPEGRTLQMNTLKTPIICGATPCWRMDLFLKLQLGGLPYLGCISYMCL